MKKIHNELNLNEDIKFQRRMWVFQRVGWVLMFLFLVAAIVGFTGSGGLGVSHKKAGGKEAGLEVEYERYLRQEAPSEMHVFFYRQRPEHRLWLSKNFVDKVQIEQMMPQPSESEINSDGVTYTFSSKGSQSEVILYLKPKKAGSLDTRLSDGVSSLSINQFVYP